MRAFVGVGSVASMGWGLGERPSARVVGQALYFRGVRREIKR